MKLSRSFSRSRAVRVGAVALTLTLAAASAARRAHALTGDVLALDPITMNQALTYNWDSNPNSTVVQAPLNFSPTTRTAYTQASPLNLPCDVNWLATGMSFRNVSTAGLYAEMGGSVYVNGDEHQPLTNVFGQTEPLATLTPLVAPGAVSTGGFIFIAQPPLYDFLPSQFPANTPLKIRMIVRGYNDPAYDVTRGGFFLSARIPESVVWNNTWFVWVRRSCPAP